MMMLKGVANAHAPLALYDKCYNATVTIQECLLSVGQPADTGAD